MNKLGVLVVGLHGAVASTVVAGVELMLKGLAPRIGMGTEKTEDKVGAAVTDWLDLFRSRVSCLAGGTFGLSNVLRGCTAPRRLPADRSDRCASRSRRLWLGRPWSGSTAKRRLETFSRPAPCARRSTRSRRTFGIQGASRAFARGPREPCFHGVVPRPNRRA